MKRCYLIELSLWMNEAIITLSIMKTILQRKLDVIILGMPIILCTYHKC